MADLKSRMILEVLDRTREGVRAAKTALQEVARAQARAAKQAAKATAQAARLDAQAQRRRMTLEAQAARQAVAHANRVSMQEIAARQRTEARAVSIAAQAARQRERIASQEEMEKRRLHERGLRDRERAVVRSMRQQERESQKAIRDQERQARARQRGSGVALGMVGVGVGHGLTRAARAGRGLIGSGLTIAMDFEQQMTDVRSVFGSIETEQFAALNAKARELGKSSKFTAKEVGEAMYAMAQAGQTFEQVMAGIGPTLQFAAAGDVELGAASENLVQILSAQGMAVKDTSRLSDILAKAADVATTNITDLAAGFSFLGPQARSAGQSLEHQAAIMGSLADKGIMGERAGTAFRGMLSRLSKMSGPAREALAKIGIKRKELDDLSDMTRVLGLFNERMADMTPAQKRKALFTIFGQETATPFAAMLESIDDIRRKEKEIMESQGFAAQKAAQRMDTTKGSVEEFHGALEELAIAASDLKLFRGLTDDIKGFTQVLSGLDPDTIKWFTRSAIGAVAFGTVMGPLLLSMSSLVTIAAALGGATGLAGVSAGFAAMATAAGAAAAAVAPVAAALAAALAAAKLLDVLGRNPEATKKRGGVAFLGEMTAEERAQLNEEQVRLDVAKAQRAKQGALMGWISGAEGDIQQRIRNIEAINQKAIDRRNTLTGEVNVNVNGPGRITSVKSSNPNIPISAQTGLSPAGA